MADVAGAVALQQRTNLDASKQLFVGGIPYLKHITSRKGWKGYIVFPLIVAPIDTSSGSINLDEIRPFISLDALKEITGGQAPSALLEELLSLEEAIGLDKPLEGLPTLDEIDNALREHNNDWPWRSDTQTPIDSISEVGLFSRWFLFQADKQVFTLGLSNDLNEMVQNDLPSGSALSYWITGEQVVPPSDSSQIILEPLSLNLEQRHAVELAMTERLTVVTGPPGTGKSQVATSILINAAYRGETVLFASKNNKAVDAVEERVNAIGPRPTLLRLGAGNLQERMTDYLTRVLSVSASEHERSRLVVAQHRHEMLRMKQSRIERDLDSVIEKRNRLDQREQEVEAARVLLGEVAFHGATNVDLPGARHQVNQLERAMRRGTKATASPLARAMWFVVGRGRERKAEEAQEGFRTTAEHLGLTLPFEVNDDQDAQERLINLAHAHLDATDAAVDYLGALAALTSLPGPDALSHERSSVADDIALNSDQLWNSWLRTLSDRMTPQQRTDLAKYRAISQQISAGARSKALRRQQIQLFPNISKFLPCWAVTSLSVRNRIPFQAEFFDLVVIDEASQCDIASALPLLMRAKRAVVIGDPMQLRHVSKLHSTRDETLMATHGITHLPQWSYSSQSLFDLAASIVDGRCLVDLRDHHRSDADIISFSNEYFYEGRLRVATHYDRLNRPDTDRAVRWIQVDGRVTTPSGGSSLNLPEAEAAVTELERLAQQGYSGSVGIVTPFRPQANRILDMARSRPSLTAFLNSSDFTVGTAHSFQGDERDVIIFSPVVADGVSPGSLRFLQNNSNLFNVAITRARAALLIVGDARESSIRQLDYLAAFARHVDSLDGTTRLSADYVSEDFGPTYPTNDGPTVSDWEKELYEALHARGIVTTPQLPVEQYSLDLALIDGTRRLDIEVDGERYHRAWDNELKRRDQLRNRRMIELGWDVMRFWVYQVRDDLDGCVDRVDGWQNA